MPSESTSEDRGVHNRRPSGVGKESLPWHLGAPCYEVVELTPHRNEPDHNYDLRADTSKDSLGPDKSIGSDADMRAVAQPQPPPATDPTVDVVAEYRSRLSSGTPAAAACDFQWQQVAGLIPCFRVNGAIVPLRPLRSE